VGTGGLDSFLDIASTCSFAFIQIKKFNKKEKKKKKK